MIMRLYHEKLDLVFIFNKNFRWCEILAPSFTLFLFQFYFLFGLVFSLAIKKREFKSQLFSRVTRIFSFGGIYCSFSIIFPIHFVTWKKTNCFSWCRFLTLSLTSPKHLNFSRLCYLTIRMDIPVYVLYGLKQKIRSLTSTIKLTNTHAYVFEYQIKHKY